jgi:hypothetical protein
MQNEYRTTNDPLPGASPTQGLNFGYTPAPQPPVQIADWAKPYYSSTANANSTEPYLSESDKAFANSGYRTAAEMEIPTEQQAYQNQLAMRQAEIDAANQTYNTLLNQTRRQNLERTGSSGARQARAGLLGSERGAAIDTSTDVFNQEQVQSVEAQRAAALSAIYGQARSDAAQMIKDKQAAKKEGYDAYITEIGRKEAKTNSAIANLAQSMVSQGLVIDDKTAADLAKTYGVDKSVIISTYAAAKKQDDADKLAIQKTESDIAKNNQFDLSEGQARYTTDPKTGEVKQIAKVAKTYAPKAVGTGVGGGTSGGGQYKTDLDAIIGGVYTTINSKNGKDAFRAEISKARNDADKINLVAKQVLRDQPADTRKDFSQKAAAIGQIDKAISAIDNGAKTGFINNAKQYTFNVFGKDYDPNLAAIGGYITSAVQPYRNSITGAAWGEQEDGEYASLFGSTKYSPKELKERLVRVKEIMKDTSIAQLNSYVNPLDTYQNPFVQQVQNVQGGVNSTLAEFGL